MSSDFVVIDKVSGDDHISTAAISSKSTTSEENDTGVQLRREPLLLIDASAYIFRAY